MATRASPRRERARAAEARVAETLIVLIGSLRGGEQTWRSLIRHVIVPSHADLALMIGALALRHPARLGQRRNMLHARAKYLWTVPERTNEEWASALDQIARDLGARNSTAWRADLGSFRVRKEMWMSPLFLGPSHWSATINLVMRWELKRRLMQHDVLQQYSRFMIARADHYYTCRLDLSHLAISNIWVPEGEDYGGVCDRAIVCGRDDVLKCLSVVDGYLVDPSSYPAWLNPEKLLMMRLERQGLWSKVRRFKRVMFISAVPGDPSRSLVTEDSMKLVPRLGVYCKYPRECKLATSNCGLTEAEMEQELPASAWSATTNRTFAKGLAKWNRTRWSRAGGIGGGARRRSAAASSFASSLTLPYPNVQLRNKSDMRSEEPIRSWSGQILGF